MRAAEGYSALFTEPAGPEGILHEGVHGYRVKRIQAGDTLEIEAYAIWETRKFEAEARAQTEKHREAVQQVNLRNQQKRLRRLMNANFGRGDLLLTLTYAPEEQPANEAQAQRDVRNYLRRMKYKRRKMGLPELKYIYVTEVTHRSWGTCYHHHLIVSGGISREEAENLWTRGIVNSRAAQPDAYGLGGWAGYMTKRKETQEKAYRRGFACSRNLKEPKITYADHKISRSMMRQIAEDMGGKMGEMILERLYPGYRAAEKPTVRISPYVPGGYLEAIMRRKE